MKHWIFAEKLNGRLAMIGLLAAVVNYGFTGWIAPGTVSDTHLRAHETP